MKKLFFLLIVLNIIISLFSDVSASSALDKSNQSDFSDVLESHKYYEAIKYVRSEGIVEGYVDGTYKPVQNINRAEFTKIVIESLYDKSEILSSDKCFIDIKDEWFKIYVCFAKQQGIINGYPDGTFKPANNVNLAEALKIIFEARKIQIDAVSGEMWYQKYINLAKGLDIFKTVNPNPTQLVNRGEMAEIIYKIAEFFANQKNPMDNAPPGFF